MKFNTTVLLFFALRLSSDAFGQDAISIPPRRTEKFLHSESFRYEPGRIYTGSGDFDEPIETSELRVQYACSLGVQRYYSLEYWSDGDHHHSFSSYDAASQTYKIEGQSFQHIIYAVQPYIFQEGICTVTVSAFFDGYPGPQAKWTKVMDISTGNATEVTIPPARLNQIVGGVKLVFPDSPNCSNIDPSVDFFDANGQPIQPPSTRVFFDEIDGKFVFSFGLKTITNIASIGIRLKGKPECAGILYVTNE